MKNIPKKIFLQVDADGETPKDFKELAEVTWCVDKIHKNDIEYVLKVKNKKSNQRKDSGGNRNARRPTSNRGFN